MLELWRYGQQDRFAVLQQLSWYRVRGVRQDVRHVLGSWHLRNDGDELRLLDIQVMGQQGRQESEVLVGMVSWLVAANRPFLRWWRT